MGSQSKSRTIHIRNAGTVAMLAAVPTQGAPFVVNGGEFIVSPHGSTNVAIEFAPKLKGPARDADDYQQRPQASDGRGEGERHRQVVGQSQLLPERSNASKHPVEKVASASRAASACKFTESASF